MTEELRAIIDSNQETYAKMKEKQKAQTCSICLKEISLNMETRLDCCDYRYCKACIIKWLMKNDKSLSKITHSARRR